jgi:HlyD family secretion protein
MSATNRKWLAAIVVALIVGVPIALKLFRSDGAKAVESERVALRALTPSVLASGTLMYESEVKLVPEVIGRVKEVLVHEGDMVKAGQLLLSLDPATSLAEIAQLDAARRQSQLHIERQQVTFETQFAKWKRYETLRDNGIIDANSYEEVASQRALAEVELNTSRAMLSQTEAQLRQAHERLAKTQIRSPIGGKVTKVTIKAGETAVPSAMSIAGSDLMVIADTAGLHAEVNVDETDVARIGIGQEAKIVPAAFPDKSWKGSVEQVAISPRQNPGQSKSYPVKIRLVATESVQFHPGMSCRAEVSTRREGAQKALAVPVQAVKYEEVQKDEKTVATVFVVDGGKARRREVETGIADDAYIELLRGVRENEEVVVGPAKTLRFLRDGDRIKVALAPAPVAPGAVAPEAQPGTGQ